MFSLPALRKVLLVPLILALAVGCNFNGKYKKDYIKRNGVIFCVSANVSNLDPISNEINVTSVTIAQNVFNRLVSYNQDLNLYEPELASSWSVSEDKMTYRIKLRRDVKFHSTSWFKPSRNLNADDVIFSFERMMDYNNSFDTIAGNENAQLTQNSYELLDFRHLVQIRQYIRNVKKINRYTVEFKLAKPYAYFLELLSNTNCIIYSKEFYDAIADSNEKESYFRNNLIGTGPFRLKSYKFNDHIILEKNPKYWKDPNLPLLEKLVLDITPNRPLRMNKMITNECQVTNQPSKAVTVKSNAQHSFNTLGSDTYDSSLLYFNTRKSPVSNLEIRTAIASSINHEVYGNVLYPHAAMTPSSLLPFDVTFNNIVPQQEISTIARNLSDKARKQLSNSGLVYVYIERSNSKMGYNISRLSQLLRADLNALGIRARVREVDSRTLSKIIAKGAYDIIVTRGIYPLKMPLYKLSTMFHCNNNKRTSGNYSAYCNDKLSEMMDLYQYHDIKDIPMEDLQQINELLRQGLPIFPISFASDYYIYHRDVKGLRRAINNGLDFSTTHVR